MEELATKKRQLRRKCFAAIKALTKEDKKAASTKISEQIRDLERFKAAKTVFSYLPLPSEPDLTLLFDVSKTWGFARVLKDDSMEFRNMANLSTAIEGEFKILEPDPEICPALSFESVDLVIIPGVGFSLETGIRLGRGKGHYDRYLSKLLERDNPPFLLGVCFSCQHCEIEAEAHDIPMDLVISDRFSSKDC